MNLNNTQYIVGIIMVIVIFGTCQLLALMIKHLISLLITLNIYLNVNGESYSGWLYWKKGLEST
jgi:hypothetical protein